MDRVTHTLLLPAAAVVTVLVAALLGPLDMAHASAACAGDPSRPGAVASSVAAAVPASPAATD